MTPRARLAMVISRTSWPRRSTVLTITSTHIMQVM